MHSWVRFFQFGLPPNNLKLSLFDYINVRGVLVLLEQKLMHRIYSLGEALDNAFQLVLCQVLQERNRVEKSYLLVHLPLSYFV
jgi:hypothetical protein